MTTVIVQEQVRIENTATVWIETPREATVAFAIDVASWQQMVSWMWMDMLRDALTIDTRGANLKQGMLVVAAGTRTLYRLRRRVEHNTSFGRKYTLWDVVSVNTPRHGKHIECFYENTLYRVLPRTSESRELSL